MVFRKHLRVAARFRSITLVATAVLATGASSHVLAGHQTMQTQGSTANMAFVSPETNQLYLFQRSAANTLKVFFAGSSGTLSSGTDYGGQLRSGPAAVSWG